ncbi:MAG: coniferyl aldehyde dehydrogenase [Halopseudomonas yangmingensis]
MTTEQDSLIEAMQQVFARQRQAFAAQPMPDAESRRQMLHGLGKALVAHQQALIEAIDRDFGRRSADETRLAELLPSIEAVHYARKRIRRWMKPSKRRVGEAFQPASARVIYQPLGVVGIMVPWNYPLYLAIGPLVGALAAGNRVMIKMSESTPATCAALQQLLGELFDTAQVAVFGGEVEAGIAFSRLPFDHLLFTGGTGIGRAIMHAAADNLTPVTLELGGKSPAIISASVPLRDAAERIAFGKAFNAGQTCVAPDYVLCPRERIAELVDELHRQLSHMYPSLLNNPDYTRIINQRQYQRLRQWLDQAASAGAQLIEINPAAENLEGSGLIAPTLVLDAPADCALLREEIFGPILPIVPCDSLDQALSYIAARPRPLALYFFGYDRSEQQRVMQHSHAGGMCINDTLLHVAQDDLPFGGIGPSGMGHYHGHEGFLTFSKAKGVFIKQRFNAARVIYPPYGGRLLKLVYRLFIR